MVAYAANQKDSFSAEGPWYFNLAAKEILRQVNPFPALRLLAAIFSAMSIDKNRVAPAPYVGSDGYGYDKNQHLWRVSDSLLLGFDRATDGDEHRLRQLGSVRKR